jgi:hypothetical protein
MTNSTEKKKTPWKDRKELLKAIYSFTLRHGGFFKQNSKRMSDLFEMTVYNDVVRFYKRKKYDIQAQQIKRDGTFNYKLSTSGLFENFSYFSASQSHGRGRARRAETVEIHHNLKIQSAHNSHIYYTADVSVCKNDGTVTVRRKNKTRHSFVPNTNLITFFEAKNLNPFAEVLFGFSGLVLEVMPKLISGDIKVGSNLGHLCPSIVFSGSPSEHTELVANELKKRYGYNVIYGLFQNKAQIYSFKDLNEKEI